MSYFKGTASAKYEFGSRVNIVKGRNGTGKTTISDAVSWVLFGTDKDGNAKFGIKTKDACGVVVAEVPHSVTLQLDVDGEEMTLSRTLRDTGKNDGGTVNSYEYRVNGEVETAGDYKKAVEAVCPEHIWKLCSQPGLFAAQNWMEQRRLLTEMFGEPDAEEIAGGDKRLAWVAEKLKKESIDDIIRHLKYKRKEVQEGLDGVPIRIEELKKTLPQEDKSWCDVLERLKATEKEREELLRKVHFIEAGQGSSVEAENIRKRLRFEEKRRREMETGVQNKMREETEEKLTETSNLAKKVTEAESNVSDLGRKRDSMDELVARCDERQKELEARKADGAALWKTITARKWEWNDKDSYCPTCGQMLPQDKVEKIMEESEARFNADVAKAKKKLLTEAQQIKDDIISCEKEGERYREERKAVQRQLEEAEKILVSTKAAQKVLAKWEIPSVEDTLDGMDSYKDVQKRIAELEKQLDNMQPGHDDNALKESFEAQIKIKEDSIRTLTDIYAKKQMYDGVMAQIDEVKKDCMTWQKQADDLDERIGEAQDWQHNACEVLEQKVNGHFGLVKWSLFAKQLDGKEKPWCECSVGGTSYGDLNMAMRINAGLDIIHTLKLHYGVDVPCIIDNTESVQNLLYDRGQQIRLEVSDDETIRIERHDY